MSDFNPQKQRGTSADHLEQHKYIKWQIFFSPASPLPPPRYWGRHIHAPTAHTIMHNEISPRLYLGAAVLMINAPLPGKLFSRRKTRREEDTWNIALRPFLLIIIIIISSYCPIYPVRECLIYWQGGGDDIWKRISWERNEQGQRNRQFLLKRADQDGVLFLLSFILGCVCLIIFVVFILKPKIINAVICVFSIPPSADIYFCTCSFVFIESL